MGYVCLNSVTVFKKPVVNKIRKNALFIFMYTVLFVNMKLKNGMIISIGKRQHAMKDLQS